MALLLDLTHLRHPQHVTRTDPASAFVADEDFRAVGDVVLDFDVEKQGDRVRLAGTVRGTLELPCSRCLEPMQWPVDAPFDIRYLPASGNVGEDEQEIGAEDLGTAFYEGDAIDLGHLVREQFYLVLPMKPLCQPTCEGLCPECGANLNAERCDCDHRWTDPRLAALGQLLPKDPPEH
jgi:uncharacterized protein